ncbi:hypothetical protein RO3G_16774 [Rhizopus delemar RA 99-880]|uniref:Reverse transcriptase domain-containing protein n=1 Tax=Rhizopus delemar (strain RA 99-880 / ATCC MYA-4621 / FGSC 9543 / NRRL 43880) TaxID=246409 RepID=I1CUD3_RHIO9|nr:hypothetical protein RO3G_16774 [Rhizopus delemar RA 99-880]|eukprot:EIE92063.1 hypothetical protein RO3G_16774 [Rhizopus delemar RA 99-880]
MSPQQQWEKVKSRTTKIIRSYSIDYVDWRTKTIIALEKKRNRLLRTRPPPAIKVQLIPPIDRQLATLQQELAEIAILKSVDPIPLEHIQAYLDTITFDPQVSEPDGQRLQQPFDFDDIVDMAKRCPKQSSPGSDGLGYTYLHMLYNLPCLKNFLIRVYDDALRQGIFPTSWKEIRIRLLPKKGNLTDLKNWRPIALINCDAKIFTRLLTHRPAPLMTTLINPFQKGFVKGRFIGENGMVLPVYLLEVLRKMNFPESIIHCIHQLFFNNSVRINVNGYLTDTVHQERGLRQGDPLSPLLFNIALEPLLLSIQQDPHYQGYLPLNGNASLRVKCIAYADDICAFVKDVEDLGRLQYHMTQYNRVSNSKFNQGKTEAFSLNGGQSSSWSAILRSQHIAIYHHKYSPSAFRYLGFYLPYTIHQRDQIQRMLLEKLRTHFNIYSQRQLSIRGRASIANLLILSRIWYYMRIFHPTQQFLKEVRSLTYNYVWQKKFPYVSMDRLTLPIMQGGLGLLNPPTQHLQLQMKWLFLIFQQNNTVSPFQEFLLQHVGRISSDPTHPVLPFFSVPLQHHSLLHPTSIVPRLFAAFDYLNISFKLDEVPLSQLLFFPLTNMFQPLPSNHWLHRYPRLPASSFLHFDSSTNRLRLKVVHEYTTLPRLFRRLYKDILERRSVKLQEFLWPHITQNTTIALPPSSSMTISPLLSQLTTSTMWSKFCPRTYCNHRNSLHSSSPSQPSQINLQYFWKTPIPLPARTVWYRILLHKTPNSDALSKCGIVSSATCRFASLMLTPSPTLWLTVPVNGQYG